MSGMITKDIVHHFIRNLAEQVDTEDAAYEILKASVRCKYITEAVAIEIGHEVGIDYANWYEPYPDACGMREA